MILILIVVHFCFHFRSRPKVRILCLFQARPLQERREMQVFPRPGRRTEVCQTQHLLGREGCEGRRQHGRLGRGEVAGRRLEKARR